jgi:hypothetical protein
MHYTVAREDEDLVMGAPGGFRWRGGFEKQRQRFDQIGSRASSIDLPSLANIEFRAQRHETVVLTLNDCGQTLHCLHDASLHRLSWLS